MIKMLLYVHEIRKKCEKVGVCVCVSARACDITPFQNFYHGDVPTSSKSGVNSMKNMPIMHFQ